MGTYFWKMFLIFCSRFWAMTALNANPLIWLYAFSSSPTMRLKVWASWPISSWYSTMTRWERSFVEMMAFMVEAARVRGRVR